MRWTRNVQPILENEVRNGIKAKGGTTRFDDPLTVSSGTLTTLVYLKASPGIRSNPSLDLFRGRGRSFFL